MDFIYIWDFHGVLLHLGKTMEKYGILWEPRFSMGFHGISRKENPKSFLPHLRKSMPNVFTGFPKDFP